MKKTLIVSLISALVCVSAVSGITYATKNNVFKETKTTISAEEAKKIMQEKVENGKLLSFEYDDDSFEGILSKDNTNYKVSVDAKTGKVLYVKETYDDIDKEDRLNAEQLSSNNENKEATSQNQDNTEVKEEAQQSTEQQQNNQQSKPQQVQQSAPQQTQQSTPQQSTQQQTQQSAPQQSTQQQTQQSAPQQSTQQQTQQSAPQQSTQQQVQQPTYQPNNNVQSSSTSYIGESRAKEIMASRLPAGGYYTKFYFEYDDGIPKYEAEYVAGTMEYSIDVNAVTGAIIDFECESIYD